MTKQQILSELNQYVGTNQYYRYVGGALLTDGAKRFAELCGAFWLLDIVATEKTEVKFLTVRIEKTEDKAKIIFGDGNKEIGIKKIDFTDFPLDSFTVWRIADDSLKSNVILLPSEY